MGYQYLLLIILSISILSYGFSGLAYAPGHEDCGPNQVFQNNQCLDIDVSGPQVFELKTDRYSYQDGDIIIISGNVGTVSTSYPDRPVTIIVIGPDGKTAAVAQMIPLSNGSFFDTLKAGGSMQESGIYKITATYGSQKSTTTFSFTASGDLPEPEPTPSPFDTVPPKILQPNDITVDGTDKNGARVDYKVLVIDETDEIVNPICTPASGSFFPIGDTIVTCSASDSAENKAKQVTFTVTVTPPSVVIPDWVKNVASFWCDGSINDASFVEGIQYLIDNGIIIVETTSSVAGDSQEVPAWVKNNACWWSQGLITDGDFASGLQYLIGQGIIQV